jgi:hypothetical protein
VLPEDSAQFASLKIWFPVSRLDNVSYRQDVHLSQVPSVRTTCHTVRMHFCLKHHPFRRRELSVRTFPCREVSNYSSVHPSGRFSSTSGRLCVRQASGFLYKAQIWEDRCNRPDDVDSCLDALIHKAGIAIQIQTFGRQSAWSRRACIRYGNCVHQINRSDNHPPWSRQAKPLYGNYLQWMCDHLDDRAPPSGRGSETGKNFIEILG